nr:G313 [uncultured bacterium]
MVGHRQRLGGSGDGRAVRRRSGHRGASGRRVITSERPGR